MYTGKGDRGEEFHSLCRPPIERDSFVIPVAWGCPYNRCLFCGDYKFESFSIIPLQQIRDYVRSAKPAVAKRVFLAAGNVIALKTRYLLDVLEIIKNEYPHAKEISCYGGARFVMLKKPEELELLKRAGLGKIYMGLESGDDEVLAFMRKGVNSEDIYRASMKLKDAGFRISHSVIMGLGGKEHSRNHAMNTAHLLNRINPDEVRLHNLMFPPGAPLSEMAERGMFIPASRREIMEETLIFLEELTIDSFLMSHASCYLRINLMLPEDKKEGVEIVKRALTLEGAEELEKEGILVGELSRIL